MKEIIVANKVQIRANVKRRYKYIKCLEEPKQKTLAFF